MKTYENCGKDYHDYLYCPVCESENFVNVTNSVDGGFPSECETKCLVCGHGDFWV